MSSPKSDLPKLDDLLDSLTVATGQVRPFFYFELSAKTETEVLNVCFQCLSCGDMLQWRKELWFCPACEFPLTAKAAADLLSEAVVAIAHVQAALGLEPVSEVGEPKERKRCHWLRFFRRRPRSLTYEKK